MATKSAKKKVTTKKKAKRKVLELPTPPPPPPPPSIDPEVPRNKRDRRRAHQRREDRRNELWPGSVEEVWSRRDTAGWTTIPRVLPLITVLLRHLTKNNGGDASSVYMELWARVYDEGYVQISNQLDHVYASGYTGSRALRTWQERMRLLEDHGFIRIQSNGLQEFGHVLLIDPLLVAARLRHEGRVPDQWWAAFRSRTDEIGAEVPTLPT